jgi:hypothetical protein
MPNITQWAVALATLLLIAVGFAFVGNPADVPSTSQQTSALSVISNASIQGGRPRHTLLSPGWL